MVDWETEAEGDYRPDRFYIAAKDKDTSPLGISVRLQTWMLRLMQVIIESRKLPYQTRSEIIRDALFHRLHYISTLLQDTDTQYVSDELRQNLEALMLSHDVIARERVALEIDSQIKSLVAVCSDIGPEGRDEARILISMVMDRIQGMQTFWRNRYAAQVQQSLGHLLTEEGE